MTDLILTIFITSLSSLGVHFITREGMILGFVEESFHDQNRLTEWLSKPLTECPTCMGSFWGLIGAIMFLGVNIPFIIITMLSVAALNTLLATYYYSNQ